MKRFLITLAMMGLTGCIGDLLMPRVPPSDRGDDIYDEMPSRFQIPTCDYVGRSCDTPEDTTEARRWLAQIAGCESGQVSEGVYGYDHSEYSCREIAAEYRYGIWSIRTQSAVYICDPRDPYWTVQSWSDYYGVEMDYKPAKPCTTHV